MAKKKRIESSSQHMIQMTKQDHGYEVQIGSTRFSLPPESEILATAIGICADYDSAESESVRILKNCEITLELVGESDVFENQIGVVLLINEDDATVIKNKPEVYSDLMSAIGEACPSIEHDRIEIRE